MGGGNVKAVWVGSVVVGFMRAVLFVLLFVEPSQGDAQVVINEVLYDPDGADGGYEFVELFNGGEGPACLDGWRLETGNGSYENRWRADWEGSWGDTIWPKGFFLIGEEGVVPAPDAVAGLDLQNGPDACRLVDPYGGSDVVGWGDLVFMEYYEGEPAEDAASGSSIGRDPDGRDSDLNKADFRVLASASPGDYNHPPRDLMVQSLGLSRYTPSTCAELDLVCSLLNAGTEACGMGATLVAEAGGFCDSALIRADLEPGANTRVVTRLPNPGPGIHQAVAWHAYEHDRWTLNDTVRTSIVVPPPPVVVNEIMFRPEGQDCEWIELLNRSDSAVNLTGWTLEDSRGEGEPLAVGELDVSAGAFLVLVEDRGVFKARHPDVALDLYREPGGAWPTLNDVDGPLGYADAIAIRDACGTMVDSVVYGRNWTPPGKSVERIDPAGASTSPANWSPHFGENPSSAGSANSVSFHLPPAGSVLTLSPQTFSPDGDGRDDVVAVAVALPGPGLVRLSVFDINGRLVKRLVDGEVVDSGRVTFWDGTRNDSSDAATGIYLLLFEARMRESDESFRDKLPVVLLRRGKR
jgi:hypothetical protein